ncbi:sialidase family protein [Paenibacillus ginsengarvi]|uniref:LamG-like jellyroll fold domain-containing protein n=1 Tax=Paenibacillus ginsengarvi TaxID=400777 RepID=A0A3B0C5B0_9BACL|nr:sialidase family protein [Paenibacillus ginsengarvi]RKN78997.1 hypothetical protein D7M11_21740 [Paenibacillus ginsengarvi]
MSDRTADYANMLVSEVNEMNASTGIFLSSPSLLRLDENTLLVTHDYSGPNSPHRKTSVHRSTDNGQTWEHVVMLDGIYWASLFAHEGSIYLLGTSGPLESIVIRKSDDGGTSWTTASDASSGLLFPGGSTGPSAYHTAPTPVLRAKGRLYKAFESNSPYVWPQNFKALVISAPENSDLLNAANWIKTNELALNPAWLPPSWSASRPGWLEGNMVQAPNGDILNVIRLNSEPVVDKAAIIKLSSDNTSISFDPAEGFIDFPGGMHKFTIRYDAESRLYAALVNDNAYPFAVQQRNRLSLYTSPDLLHWSFAKLLIRDDSQLSVPYSIAKVGFQYADWHWDGDDIIFAARTSYDGADTYHNANRITFHRLEKARDVLDLPHGYWKFDDGTGTTAADSSTHGADGTIQGAAWTTGYRSGGLEFDGADDLVLLPDALATNLRGAPAVTIAGWFRNDSLPSPGQPGNWLLGVPVGQTSAGAEVLMLDNRIRVGGRSKPNEDYKYADFPFSVSGEWHHAAGVLDYERNVIRFYLDGMEQKPLSAKTPVFGSRAFSPQTPGSSSTIGASPLGGGFFAGTLDEVKLYGRALDPREIRQLVYDGLTGYWPLDGAATTAGPYADLSRYGNDAKRMGGSGNPGYPDRGVKLDGVMDYAALGYKPSAALNGAPAITIAGWFQDGNVPDSNPKWLYGTRIHGATAGAEITLTSTAIRVAGRSDSADSFQTKSFPYIRDSGWHHAAGILDFAGNAIRLYVDGVELSPSGGGTVSFRSRTYKRLVPSQADSIGRSPGDSGYFGGELGHFFIFGKTLSQAEIEFMYRTQKRRFYDAP